MGALSNRYNRLRPSLELLADEAILAQAWKKSDAHIRKHNWYADLLELDCALVELPDRLALWSRRVAEGRLAPLPMRVVPAPKNASWSFAADAQDPEAAWKYVEAATPGSIAPHPTSAGPELRPLAHLAIRDQTLATAVMLCLADAIETLQGDTDQPNHKTAQQRRVYSYGNRLFCDWTNAGNSLSVARFRWGNTTTYTQFFQDYQRFLARAADVCRDASERAHGSNRRLYVVSLDISKFYDCVDRLRLHRRLRRLYRQYASRFDPEYREDRAENFWDRAAAIMNWRWHDGDQRLARLFGTTELPHGLPQGLVASGFFANAYMLLFDRVVGRKIGRVVNGVRLLDYCRYVDDLRLVIECEATHSSVDRRVKNLVRSINTWLHRSAGPQLCIQDGKTDVMAWQDMAEQGRTSEYMRVVQKQISGTPDTESLRQTTAGLGHLLSLADALAGATKTTNILGLSHIAAPRVDVRDDTIVRFTANRLRKVLRLRRGMAEPVMSGAMRTVLTAPEERALDQEMEAVARKLVACWARNPSLVSVLRCGLDIFPDPDLVGPVLEALRAKLSQSPYNTPNETKVAEYVLADLLKAGAVETGCRGPHEYPEHANIEAYRRELKKLALDLLHTDVPWFLRQQAAMFLASQKFPVDLRGGGRLRRYRLLHDTLRYKPQSMQKDLLAIALIAQRIDPSPSDFALWFGTILKRYPDRAHRLASQLGLLDSSLLFAVVRAHPEKQLEWRKWVESLLPPRTERRPAMDIDGLGQSDITLAVLARNPDNPFGQENALLKLAEALLVSWKRLGKTAMLGLRSLRVSTEDWKRIQDPDTELRVTVDRTAPPVEAEFGGAPPWCQKGMEWTFTLGRLLRSAMVAEDDYTSRVYPLREGIAVYRGLRTSWFKRRYGMAVPTDGLGEEPAPISSWLTEFILRLLQWPGLEIHGELGPVFAEARKPSDLLPAVRQRKRLMATMYGKLSKMPVYETVVPCSDGERLRHFRMAVVQTLLPRDSDFSSQDPTSWTTSFRKLHRAHLASVSRLILQHLRVVASARTSEAHAKLVDLDLIVFPELSVHPDDLWMLKRLSDVTGAAVLAGLTFCLHPIMPKPINRAVWILRQPGIGGRRIITVYQGKKHMTNWESEHGVVGYRPYQVVVRFLAPDGDSARVASAICYDATDLRLLADLREVSDAFVIPALNRDIHTFDTMTEALQYHMFQPVLLANSGQYGGSNAQAPYKEHYHRMIAHVHGNNQAAVSLFELDLLAFRTGQTTPPQETKTPPAGYCGRAAAAT